MATVLAGTALLNDITLVRTSSTPMAVFRAAVRRIGLHIAAETTKYLPERSVTISTPLESTTATVIDGHVVLVPVLRAGLGLLDAFLDIVPDASVGYLGLKRNEETLEPQAYYQNLPPIDATTTVIVLDPMLATGGSMKAALSVITPLHPKKILAASLIAAPEGINEVESAYPSVSIVVGTVDRCLNDHGYIVPGLGDAGDRLFGTT